MTTISASDEAEQLQDPEILDFSGNVYPAAVPDKLRDRLREAAASLEHYPDPEGKRLRLKAAENFGVLPGEVLMGNGICELLYVIARALEPRRVIISAPCSHDYWRAAQTFHAEPEGILAGEAQEFAPDFNQLAFHLSGADMAFFSNPNDITGVAVAAGLLRELARKNPRVLLLVDESFIDFVPETTGASLLDDQRPPNVIILRSPTLSRGLPGLRLAYMIASADIVNKVEITLPPGTVGSFTLAAGEALIEELGNAAALREPVLAQRERVREELSRFPGIRVFRSQTNFLLIKTTRPGLTAATLCRRMLDQKALIRNAAGFRGLDGRFARISLRCAEDNSRLIDAMLKSLDESLWK